jgi:hypothetical protein
LNRIFRHDNFFDRISEKGNSVSFFITESPDLVNVINGETVNGNGLRSHGSWEVFDFGIFRKKRDFFTASSTE